MIQESLFKSSKSKESAVDSVVNKFRNLLVEHKIRPGDHLPSEGMLAEQMGVSRGSLREAMKILIALGVVEIHRGNGTYISRDSSRAAIDPFLLQLMMSDYNRQQMIEFRQMIEYDVARMAVLQDNKAAIQAMRQAIAAMENGLAGPDRPDASALANLDITFHLAMARATGNVLVQKLYEYVLKFFEPSILETYHQSGNIERALAYHRDILKAMLKSSETEMLQAVERSIQGWTRAVLDRPAQTKPELAEEVKP
jgi:GntR family transcriptional regulator, transcriptional repressor for pyruvate dehydrogenase complex